MKPAPLVALSLCLSAFTPLALAQAECAGKTGEAAATCRKEEAAARKAEKRGELQSGINYRDNALARCDPLPASDKDDCIRRVQGQGTVNGSVEGGGIYRETRTITIGSSPGAETTSGSEGKR